MNPQLGLSPRSVPQRVPESTEAMQLALQWIEWLERRPLREHLHFRRMDESERRSISAPVLRKLVEVMGLAPGRVSGNEAWEGCAKFGGEVVRRPRGRPRKVGRRKRSGDLVVRPDKPAAIAATIPHRHALGEKAVDQLAESELGRLALRRARAGAGDRRGGLCAALAGGTSRTFVLPEPL